jgi:hypothetical protein
MLFHTFIDYIPEEDKKGFLDKLLLLKDKLFEREVDLIASVLIEANTLSIDKSI